MALSCIIARYSELLVENRDIFILHLYLAPPKRMTRRNFAKVFDTHKTRMIGLSCGYDDLLSRFHTIPERSGQTDGQTDIELLCQYRAVVC